MEKPEATWATAVPDTVWRQLTVDPISACWLWNRYLTKAGYGMARVARRTWLVHRLIWFAANGPPIHDSLDHLCRVRRCANPAHLEDVPRGENLRRGQGPTFIAWRAGTCTKGHDNSNLWRRADGRSVYCKACKRERRERERTERAAQSRMR